MSLNYRQQRQLYRIESRLLRSDPRLAAKLVIFGRLAAGQGLPSWEHITTRRDRVRQAAAMIAKAIAVMATAIGLLASAVAALFTAILIGSRTRPPRPARPGLTARNHP